MRGVKLTIRIRCSPKAILAGLCGSSLDDGVSAAGSSFIETSSSDATASAGFVFGAMVAFGDVRITFGAWRSKRTELISKNF